MKSIRPFTIDDIEQVAALHRRVFGSGDQISQPMTKAELDDYADYFERIFLGNPWYSEMTPSLVSLGPTGRVTGFLGIFPRRMTLRGRTINVAISSQFIVDPDNKALGAGLGLLKSFLTGPQDLSLTDEANDISRRIWEGLGGISVPSYSIHWTRVLRPGGRALSQAAQFAGKGGAATSVLKFASRPVSNLVDYVAARALPKRFAQPEPGVAAEIMTTRMLLDCMAEFSPARALWPEYDQESLEWLIETIEIRSKSGPLRMVEVRGTNGGRLGWYVYIPVPAGESSVLQLMARKSTIGAVLDHLLFDAWSNGSTAVTGRFDPQFIGAFSDKRCSLRCGYPWFLVNSRDRELLRTIADGDALISRLEGEWCLHFR